MTPEQAKDFLIDINLSDAPNIKNFLDALEEAQVQAGRVPAWRKACKALGPIGIIGTISILLYNDEPIDPGIIACEAMWGCGGLQ